MKLMSFLYPGLSHAFAYGIGIFVGAYEKPTWQEGLSLAMIYAFIYAAVSAAWVLFRYRKSLDAP